ncbi:MAG: hypothetical protein NTV45_08145 [Firmicutes bacterium]|nr:hypothetical protein [Bacillota bacterium]
MTRCAYCKKQGASQKTAVRMWTDGKLQTVEMDYCSDNCKQNLHAFTQTYNRFAPKFLLIAFIWAMLMLGLPLLLQTLTGNPIYLAIMLPSVLAFMGLVLIIYPVGIVTRNYYNRLGIKYTTWFIRLTGLLMIGAGLNLLWFR